MARSRVPVLVDPAVSGDQAVKQGVSALRRGDSIVEIPDENNKPQRYTTLKHPGTKDYFNIKAAMGLTDDNPQSKEGKAKSELFRQIRSKIRFEFKASMTMDEWETITWGQVGSTRKANVAAEALIAQPYLRRFPNNWATEELMMRMLQNSRCSAKQKGRKSSVEEDNNAEDKQDEGDKEAGKGDEDGEEDDEEDDDDEEEGNDEGGEHRQRGNREGADINRDNDDEDDEDEGEDEDGDETEPSEPSEPPEPPNTKGKGKQTSAVPKTARKGRPPAQSVRTMGAPTTLKRKAPKNTTTLKNKSNNKRTRTEVPAPPEKAPGDEESDWEARVEAELAAKSTVPVKPKTKKAKAVKGPSNPAALTAHVSATTKNKKRPYPKMRPPPALTDENVATSSGTAEASRVPGKDTFDLSRSHSGPSKTPSRRQAGRTAKLKNSKANPGS